MIYIYKYFNISHYALQKAPSFSYSYLKYFLLSMNTNYLKLCYIQEKKKVDFITKKMCKKNIYFVVVMFFLQVFKIIKY